MLLLGRCTGYTVQAPGLACGQPGSDAGTGTLRSALARINSEHRLPSSPLHISESPSIGRRYPSVNGKRFPPCNGNISLTAAASGLYLCVSGPTVLGSLVNTGDRHHRMYVAGFSGQPVALHMPIEQ